MKKYFTALFCIFYFSIETLLYASLGDETVYAPLPTTVNPVYASPVSNAQNPNLHILLTNPTPQPIDYRIYSTVSDNYSTVYIGLSNGMFYANGTLLGTKYTTSKRSGVTLLNGIPLKDYYLVRNSSNTSSDTSSNANSKTKNIQTDPLYFQAYTKFLLKDYAGSVADCNAVISSDSTNLQASLMKTVAQAAVDKKITSEEAQSKLDQILKISE